MRYVLGGGLVRLGVSQGVLLVTSAAPPERAQVRLKAALLVQEDVRLEAVCL